MKWLNILVSGIVVFFFPVSCSTAQFDKSILAISGKMIEIGKPVQITVDGSIDSVSWSPGGKQLAYVWYDHIEKPEQSGIEEEPVVNCRAELRLYDGRRTTVIKRIETPLDEGFLDWGWLPDGKNVFVCTGWSVPKESQKDARGKEGRKGQEEELFNLRGRLEVISLKGGAPQTIIEADNLFTIDQLYLSPDKTKLLLYRYLDAGPSSLSKKELYVFDLRSRELTSLVTGNYLPRVWTQDSSAFYYAEHHDNAQTNYYRYDLKSKAPVAINREEMASDMAASRELLKKHFHRKGLSMEIETVRSSKDTEDAKQIQALWLVSTSTNSDEFKRALITTDIDEDNPGWFSLSPTLHGLAYVNRYGQLFIVPLTMRDPEGYNERRACGIPITEDELREHYLKNAMQIAVSLIMYAADNDDTLPAAGDVTSMLMTYVKNRNVFLDWKTGENIFRYLGNGQSLDSIREPASTRIGYLNTGGDWVPVIYADGHVKYEKRSSL